MLSTAANWCLFVLTPARGSLRLSSFLVNQHSAQLTCDRLLISVTLARDLSTFSTLRMSENPGGDAQEGGEPVKTAKQLKREAQKKEKTEKFLAKNQAEKSAKVFNMVSNNYGQLHSQFWNQMVMAGRSEGDKIGNCSIVWFRLPPPSTLYHSPLPPT